MIDRTLQRRSNFSWREKKGNGLISESGQGRGKGFIPYPESVYSQEYCTTIISTHNQVSSWKPGSVCMYVIRRNSQFIPLWGWWLWVWLTVDMANELVWINFFFKAGISLQAKGRTHTHTHKKRVGGLHLVSKEASPETCRVFCALLKCCHSDILGTRFMVFASVEELVFFFPFFSCFL